MKQPTDRLKGALRAVARGAFPEFAYGLLYRGSITNQNASLTRVDVVPDDERLPPMGNIPFRAGFAGLRVQLRFLDDAKKKRLAEVVAALAALAEKAKTAALTDEEKASQADLSAERDRLQTPIRCAIGWENARPDRPFAALVSAPEEGVSMVELGGAAIRLGAGAGEAIVLGTSYRHQELKVDALILAFAQAVSAALAATGSTPPPSKAAVAAALAQLNTAILEFNGQDYLSTVATTK